jgi:hypothetical protein
MPGAEGVPEWLQDFLSRPQVSPAETSVPPTPTSTGDAMFAPPQPAEPSHEETGVDPLTGRVFDSAQFERWLEEQNIVRKTRLAMESIPSLHERLQKAKFEIEEWADNPANRPLVLSGDLEAVRADASLREVLRGYDDWGPEMTDKLYRHVAFVVENRRKFHASRPSD